MGGLRRENSDVSVEDVVIPSRPIDDDATPTRTPRAPEPVEPDPLFRLLVVASVAATIVMLVVLFVWNESVFAFTFDDAYYYFGIARNLAAGHGSTFDGINLTNGYHPLWLLVATVPFKLGLDDLDAARALIALQLIVGWGCSLVIISRILSRSINGWTRVSRREAHEQQRARQACTVTMVMVFFLVAVNPFIIKVFVNGLETGIVVTMLAFLLLVGSTPPPGAIAPSRRWITGTTHAGRLGLSVVLALGFLGRTDVIILIGCLFLWCVAEIGRKRASLGLSAAALVELFAVPAATIGIYLVYNRSTFGTYFQVSGLVKRAETTAGTVVTFGVFLLVAAAIGAWTFTSSHRHKRRHGLRFKHAGAFASNTGWYAAFCVILVGYYAVLQTQIWLWYFAPLVLYGVILLMLSVVDMCEVALRDGRQNTNPAHLVWPVQILFGVLLAAALVVEIAAFRDPNQLSIQIADRDTGYWLRDNTDPNAVAGSWDAGAVGYFSHRSVIDLDGLVNSHEYYEAARHHGAARFLRCERLAYVANHGDPADGDDPSFRDLIREVYGPDAATRTTIEYHQPFLFDGTTQGSAGSESGLRQIMSYVYKIPPDAVTGDPSC